MVEPAILSETTSGVCSDDALPLSEEQLATIALTNTNLDTLFAVINNHEKSTLLKKHPSFLPGATMEQLYLLCKSKILLPKIKKTDLNIMQYYSKLFAAQVLFLEHILQFYEADEKSVVEPDFRKITKISSFQREQYTGMIEKVIIVVVIRIYENELQAKKYYIVDVHFDGSPVSELTCWHEYDMDAVRCHQHYVKQITSAETFHSAELVCQHPM
ncbi:MAG: hypothetical protein Harvfovirus1_83 [Harvfovirus sp.]|uniref:Uncharacterized protein n=1 Tax=Harvfovirus sp. TaxID=2487768 RepID=A0A3G4ZZW4_9VIRU|nr:MAG: hypothetical protein Harvfovirus1_83 [Harvfovirus sp.]